MPVSFLNQQMEAEIFIIFVIINLQIYFKRHCYFLFHYSIKIC